MFVVVVNDHHLLHCNTVVRDWLTDDDAKVGSLEYKATSIQTGKS